MNTSPKLIRMPVEIDGEYLPEHPATKELGIVFGQMVTGFKIERVAYGNSIFCFHDGTLLGAMTTTTDRDGIVVSLNLGLQLPDGSMINQWTVMVSAEEARKIGEALLSNLQAAEADG